MEQLQLFGFEICNTKNVVKDSRNSKKEFLESFSKNNNFTNTFYQVE